MMIAPHAADEAAAECAGARKGRVLFAPITHRNQPPTLYECVCVLA